MIWASRSNTGYIGEEVFTEFLAIMDRDIDHFRFLSELRSRCAKQRKVTVLAGLTFSFLQPNSYTLR